MLLLFFSSSCFQIYVFFIVVVVHARILYGTNAQETKITLFGDGGDKLVGCFRQGAAAAKKEKLRMRGLVRARARTHMRTRSYAHAFHSSYAAALLC